jgi:hypothetical protein
VLADGKRRFYLNENIVKAAKDIITNIQASKSDTGQKVRKPHATARQLSFT